MTTYTLIQSYAQNFVHSPPHFPILTLDIMLTTCAMVDAFKFQCGGEVSRSIESCILVIPFDVLGSTSVIFMDAILFLRKDVCFCVCHFVFLCFFLCVTMYFSVCVILSVCVPVCVSVCVCVMVCHTLVVFIYCLLVVILYKKLFFLK